MALNQTSASTFRFVALAILGTTLMRPASLLAQASNQVLVPPDLNQAYSKPPTGGENILAQYKLSEDEKLLLSNAINSPARIDKTRDVARHPYETLEFFGIRPNAKVVEIWPGQGWYSTVLAEYLRQGGGELVAGQFDTSTTNSQLVRDVVENYSKRFANNSQKFGRVTVVPFGPRSKALGEKDSVDAVLTFRNIHNWLNQGWAEKAFDDFYKVLKPGGILGIEEHRASEESPQDPLAADGYVREDYVIDLAKEAGFVLIKSSEINANPNDTKDHPFGVWTLPPVGRTAPYGKPPNPNFDQTKYKEIGESDRMTLLFMKPFPPPSKMAKVNDKEVKPSNPLNVIFGSGPETPKNTVAVKDKPEENKYKIVFEPVNAASLPPKSVVKASPSDIGIEKSLAPPTSQKVDFSGEKPPAALPDFTIPTWEEVQKKPSAKAVNLPEVPAVKTPVKPVPKNTSNAKASPSKSNNTANKAPQKSSSKTSKEETKTKSTPQKGKTAVSSKKEPVKKTSTPPNGNKKAVTKPKSTTTKKDPNVPDWNVKTKKNSAAKSPDWNSKTKKKN